MPVFSYHSFNADGVKEHGTIEASTEKRAFDTLQSRGLTVYQLDVGQTTLQSDVAWYRRDIQIGTKGLSYDEQAKAADLLATLFEAQLSAVEVFRIASTSSESPEVRRQFERVGQRIAEGAPIGDAFEAENRMFSPIFVSFLRISDQTNTLPRLLRDLGQFFQRQHVVREKVVSALIYPAILLVAASLLLLVVVLYLAPNLEPIFASVGKTPPATLGFLLAINSGLKSYWLVGVIGLCAIGGGLVIAVQRPSVRHVMWRFRLRMPLFGPLLRLSELARLTHALDLLLRSGMPLSRALSSAADAMGGHSGLAKTFTNASSAVESGAPASSVFLTDAHLSPLFKELFHIGEHTNKLASTLPAISTALTTQVDRRSQRILGLLTPFLTLVMGIGIGFLVYTLMGAILEVNELAF